MKTTAERCRACDGATAKAFTTRILGRYDVSFHRCTVCGSLQSETPYWLDEAYRSAIAVTDTGAVSRNLSCHAAIFAVAKVLNLKGRFLDFGGGTGMLCRLLRDSGFDAYLYDRYADPVYARAFALDARQLQGSNLALLSAMEVLEHCASPAKDVGDLFALRPRLLMATTITYNGEGADWWYIGQATGQHVFFYSRACLEGLARKYGYEYLGVGHFHLFSQRSLAFSQRSILRMLLSSTGLRLLQVWIAATRRGRYAEADNLQAMRQLDVLARQHDDTKSPAGR